MKKRLIKSISLFQIYLLIISIISFSLILNINFVSADNKWVNANNVPIELNTPELIEKYKGVKQYDSKEIVQEEIIKNFQTTSANTPPVTSTPTHGYAGQAYESFFGKGTTAPKDTPIPKGEGVDKAFTASGAGYSTSGILQGASWALLVAGAVQAFAPMFGADADMTSALTSSLAGGMFVGKSAAAIFGEGGYFQIGKGLSPGLSFTAGLATAAIIFYMTYKSEETETVDFQCDPWQAPTGGSDCEKCNKQGRLPCSEYQCRSLGQSCQLLNPGTDEESCTWVNRNDVNPPVIKPLNDALLDGYVYAPDTAISPPDKGVKVQNSALASKCAEAFTPLTFGIITNEPAQCKISPLREDSFEDMILYFGASNLFTYNHTQVMKLPGADALEAEGLTLENDGNFEVYTRCQDANGNANTANFVFKYCVEKGPDTTPPLIVTTDLLNDMPIAYDQTSIDLNVYTNEPADCKWDYLDKDYDSMDTAMTCSSSIFEMNAQMLYACSTTLTGLKNEFENEFYFRCKDLAENTNAESYLFTLIGTQPLVIDYVYPDWVTIKDSTDVVQVVLEVETSAGYNDGDAACYYSNTGEEDSYVMFSYTNSYEHFQELWFNEGMYDYFIKCNDLGGNTDETMISFDVESDVVSPLVVRVYHEGTYLKLITNEDAECVYDTTSCSYTFEDGIKMNVINGINHYTDWDTNVNFYIKCQDSYGNKPLPDKCNIIAKPADI